MHSFYGHLQKPSSVKKGACVDMGKTILGYVGETGSAKGCHLHFEILHFSSRYLEEEEWYGKGNQRRSAIFRENWIDPRNIFSTKKSANNTVLLSRGNSADSKTDVQARNKLVRFSIAVRHIHDYFMATGA